MDTFSQTFDWVSPKALTLTGYNEDEIIGKRVVDFIPGSFAQKRKILLN